MEDVIKCPYCGSQHVVAGQKGFSAGKAIAGDIIAGPIGLLAGFHGSNDIVLTCIKCGTKFTPKDLKNSSYGNSSKPICVSENPQEEYKDELAAARKRIEDKEREKIKHLPLAEQEKHMEQWRKDREKGGCMIVLPLLIAAGILMSFIIL